MKLLKFLLLYTLCFLSAYAYAKTDINRGKELAETCAACHGPSGHGLNPAWPKLAGQNTKYFIKQMNAFRKGKKGGRYNEIMQGITSGLSEQDIVDLAAYFSTIKAKPGLTDPKLLASGEQIYRGGVLNKGIPACSACHGPRGKGNAEAAIPALRGQYAKYTIDELKAYQQNNRTTGAAMTAITQKMSDKEMLAVASYIQGLY